MPDKISKEERSKIMSKIRSKNTKPEKILNKIMKERGLDFKRHYGEFKVDFAFPKQKVMVFIDGCFWHGCKLHRKKPKSNVEYWSWKIDYNMKRDRRQNSILKKNGWKVIRLWEHSIYTQPKKCLDSIEKILNTSSNLPTTKNKKIKYLNNLSWQEST